MYIFIESELRGTLTNLSFLKAVPGRFATPFFFFLTRVCALTGFHDVDPGMGVVSSFNLSVSAAARMKVRFRRMEMFTLFVHQH